MSDLRAALAEYLNAARISRLRAAEAAPYVMRAKEADEAKSRANNRLSDAYRRQPGSGPYLVRYGGDAYVIRWSNGLQIEQPQEIDIK